MARIDLDDAFDPTPYVFTSRVDTTLRTLGEEKPMKRFTIRTALIALLVAAQVCAAAYALVTVQGQEWYYDNLFTAYRENEPEKEKNILAHLQTQVLQAPSEDAQGLVTVTVQDYAWVPEEGLLTVSFATRVKDGAAYELHGMQHMDPDGHWGPVPDPADKESRTEHWLYTQKGFGLPKDVMNNPAKKLLLADIKKGGRVWLGSSDSALEIRSSDSFAGEGGSLITVVEIDLSKMADPELPQQQEQDAPVQPGQYVGPGDTGEDVRKLQTRLAELGYYKGEGDGTYSDAVQLAVAAFQKENSLVADGVAGPATQNRLYSAEAAANPQGQPAAGGQYNALRPGDTGEEVRKLQTRLAELGHYKGEADGTYSDAVQLAVAAFQKANSLTADGVAGLLTQSWLYDLSQSAGEREPASAQEEKTGKTAQGVSAEILKYVGADGMLALRLPYEVVLFAGNEYGAASGGTVDFQVEVR